MKFRRYLAILMIASLTVISGCAKDEVVEDVSRTKTVETYTIKTQTLDDEIVYFGHVESGTMTKLSFKSSGVLKDILVQKGDAIAKGDPVASLDASDYNIQLAAAQDGARSVNASLNKATEAYNDALKDYQDYQKLFEAGSISQSNLDKIKLNVDIAEQDVNAAKEGYQQALRNVQGLSKSVNELEMVSSVDGIVVETLYEANEAVGAGYPVVVIRSEDSVFKTSVAQKDLAHLSLGQAVSLKFGDDVYSGSVTLIGNTPDAVTRTFDVEVEIDGDVPLGTVGEGHFIVEEYTGIIIPLEVVVKGTYDYVYVVEEGIAHKRAIDVVNRIDNMLLVEGLNENDQIVVKGYNRLNDGDVVNILNEVTQ